MPVYIQSSSCLSPQATHRGFSALDNPAEYNTNLLWIVDPEYKNYINPVQIRRMSRVNKMGLTAARICMEMLHGQLPEAIITGTGYGCIADTRRCMQDLADSNEQNLVPNQFMQTTQNSVAGLIALGLKCNAYNFTYVHRGFSFEHAAMDAMFQIQNNHRRHVLLGSFDENTADSIRIYSRIQQYKLAPVSTMALYNDDQPGSIKGEGSAFFWLSAEPAQEVTVQLSGIRTIYKPKSFDSFIEVVGEMSQPERPSLILAGYSGDQKYDSWFDRFLPVHFLNIPVARFKHLSGEYATASSFACWSAYQMLVNQYLPPVYQVNQPVKELNSVLICNQYFGRNFSFIRLDRIK